MAWCHDGFKFGPLNKMNSEPVTVDGIIEGGKKCRSGKVRNRKTGRCRKCPSGQVRSRKSKHCRSKKAARRSYRK